MKVWRSPCAETSNRQQFLRDKPKVIPKNTLFAPYMTDVDGQEIALGNSVEIRNIFIVEVETGEVRKLLELPDEVSASSPAWQP